MRILLLSAYDAPSHRYWMRGLIENLTSCIFTCLTLPPRHFNWRIRGNPLSWLNRPELRAQYDLVLATSMVDLATLRGLVPNLTRVPCILYCHENQFAYPESLHQNRPLEPLMVNLYSALACDALVFNSDWNSRSFMHGVEQLLSKMPDQKPAGLLEQLAAKAEVLPVPLSSFGVQPCNQPGPFNRENPLVIVWNHRWEFDKGPDLLLAVVAALPRHLPLRFHIIGQQFRQQPPQFALLKDLLQNNFDLANWGFCADATDYQALLASSHVVLSTAWHDFQGLAVLEAAGAGAVPLAPNALAYPEWFAAEYCYGNAEAFDLKRIDILAAEAAQKITDYAEGNTVLKAVDTRAWQWRELGNRYVQLFARVSEEFNRQ